MKRHGLIRFIAIVLFVVGFLALLGGIFGGTSFANGGFGSGWGPGSRAWLAWPFIGAGLSTALFLWFLGAVLWLLVAIDANLAEARARGLDVRLARRARPAPALAGSLAAPGAVAAGAPAVGAAVAGAAVAGAAVARADTAPEAAPEAPKPAPAPGPDVPPVVTAAIPAVVAASVPDKSAPAPEGETPAGEAPAEAAQDAAAEAAEAAAAAGDAAEAAIAAQEPAGEAAAAVPEAPAAAADAAGAAQDAATDAAEAAAAAGAAYRAPEVEISGYDLDEVEEDNGTGEEGPAGEFTGRLPGSDEAARVAAEMKEQKPADEDNPPAATM